MDEEKVTDQDEELPEDDEEGPEEEGNDEHAAEVEGSEDSTPEEGSDEPDEEREAIRARRRQERHDKKEASRQREAQARREKEMLRKENEELAQRLAVLERRSQGSDFAQLDNAINQTGQAIVYLKEQIKIATEAGDGATVADATEKLYKAQKHGDHLLGIKQQAVNNTRQTEQRSPIDPQLRRHAEGWMDQHNWYDPSGKDPDSRVALTVDQSMAEEGWDPRQAEYWAELDSRLKRYLPHRYKSQERQHDGNGGTQRRTSAPVTGSGRESGAPNGPTFKLSADRVNAIKEAGKWENPDERDKMIKKYKEYDKQQAQH